MKLSKIPYVWTNDDISYGNSVELQELFDFLDRFSIRGTFFVIPKNADLKPISEDHELIKVLKGGLEKKHEFHQHGYIHTPFESGVPDCRILDLAPSVKKSFSTNRFEIEASHELPKLIQMLESGIEIWEKVFGDQSKGYRPGWGAFCGNLYKALEQCGFDWVSARFQIWTSYLMVQGIKVPLEFDTEQHGPYNLGKMCELPMNGEYIDKFGNLPKLESDLPIQVGFDEFMLCVQEQIPFVQLCHPPRMKKEKGNGFEIQSKLIPKILESGYAEPMTMNQAFEWWKSQGKKP
jgi:hypothetical protein